MKRSQNRQIAPTCQFCASADGTAAVDGMSKRGTAAANLTSAAVHEGCRVSDKQIAARLARYASRRAKRH